MKLYYSPGACSLAPHIILHEAQLPFSLEKVDLATHKTSRGEDYYSINSRGSVPLLELDNGERLSEGPIVAQYIADQAKSVAVIPAPGTIGRYRVMEWQNYVTSELHKSFTPLFNPDVNNAAKVTLAAVLRKKYEWLNTQLRGKEYLTGNTFSVADAYLFTVTNWAKHVGLELGDLVDLQTYLKRVAARPAVRAAMKTEGLLV